MIIKKIFRWGKMAGERNVLAVKAVISKKHFKSSFRLSGHSIVYYLGQVTYYKQKSSHPTDVNLGKFLQLCSKTQRRTPIAKRAEDQTAYFCL